MIIFRVTLLMVLFVFASGARPSSADQIGLALAYVSAKGTDTGYCNSVSSPCSSIQYAAAQTVTGGTILCVDTPQQFASFTITTSVTIQCTGVVYGPLTINLPSNDTKQTVHIVGLTMNDYGASANAIVINAAGNVILQNMVIEGTTNGAVKDTRTSPGKLEIMDTAIIKNAGLGLVVAGAAGNIATLDNVTLSSNTYGIAVASGNRVSISRSSISGNSVAGVEADGGSLVIVDGSTISNNNVGIQSGSAIRVSNSNIIFNTTGVNGATGTYGNNRFAGNGSDGTALTPVGATSTDLAQK